MVSKPNWRLYQYHVDFEPTIQSKRLKIGLVKQRSDLFPNNAFDGSTLFTTTKLLEEVTTITATTKRDNMEVRIIIKKTADIYPSADSFEIDRYVSMEEEEQMQNWPAPEPGAPPRRRKDKTNDFIRLLNVVFKK